ncbi:DNA topoisomerase I [Parcubacteria bacterium DG_74_2]|nr:MAG: DNA topoisomerase I [Parcubacteria bacterium DG_74_2]
MRLLIVESPTKSKTLSKFLGQEYQVLSSYGHIRDLPKSELGIDIEQDFEPRYVIPTKSRKVIGLLKKALEQAEKVILATDGDREGEAIAWHIVRGLDLDGKKPYQRIVFHEITKSAIEQALKHPRKINKDLVEAQQARRILDRLVGYKLSPFLWKKVMRGLSAGRVQSVAVRLVCEREKEIENFTAQEYWSIVASLLKIKNQNAKIKEFEAILVKKDNKTIPKLGIKSKKEADEILKDLERVEYKVAKIEKKEIKRNPLPPFTTSSLQQEAWKRFHWSAKFTMRIAQQLYEKGFITYHRTDSLNLSDLSLFAAKKFILTNYGKDYWPGFFRKYKTKTKSAQEAHEAIRPTRLNFAPPKDKNQARLYDLIWRRFISSQMSQASFDSTMVEIETGNPKSQAPNPKQIPSTKSQIQNKYTFRATGQILKFDGFLKVYPVKSSGAGISPKAKLFHGVNPIKYKENELPVLGEKQVLKLIKLIPGQHFTQPPSRYTEAGLIKVLEENGIGRPSTYAPVISVIQERNYVEKNQDKRFQPTEIGIKVDDILTEHFSQIVSLKFTAQMEQDLDKIAQGKEKWIFAVKKFYKPFEKNLEQKYKEVDDKHSILEKTEKKCPKCHAHLVIRLGRFGKFLACSNFPKCKYTEPLKKPSLGIKCPKCKKGEIVKKVTKTRKVFYGCDKFPDCDFALWDKPTGEKCEKCGSLIVETKKGKKCSNESCQGHSK